MPQLSLTAGEYGLEGEISLSAWENWQTEETDRIRLDFGGDRIDQGQELTESYRKALAYLFADQEAVKVAILSGILCFFAQQEQALLSDAVEEDFGLDCLPHIPEI